MNEHFICEIDWPKSDLENQNMTIRTNLIDMKNAIEWVNLFSSILNTNWIVSFELNNPQNYNDLCDSHNRVIFHKYWTQEVFLSYFDDGLTASEAIHLHESKLIVQENSCYLLANASINPTKRQVHKSVTISIQGEATWAVLIVTPIMERAHKLKCSQEIIFLDSTSSVDTTNIPIPMQAPMVFMSDDSRAEKNSLHSVWPSAKQFLCHFHMAQAEWRWLHDTKNGIQLDDRCPLMRLFQKRFERNFNRKEEVIKLYRLHILYRNHETNNYAEASIRVVKDILLSRTKAYNVVALVDFIVNVGENYFTLRLLDHAHDRHSESHRLYTKLCSKIGNIVKDDVKQINNCTYSIPRESSPKNVYIINTEMGICSCKIGCTGAFCKHQAWIHENLKMQLPNLPPITLIERHALGILALGDKCPETAFFLGLKECLPGTSANNEVLGAENAMEQNSNNTIIEPSNSVKEIDFNVFNNTELIAETDSEWLRLQKMVPSLPPIILKKLVKNLKNIKTNQRFVNFIHTVNTSARTVNRRGKIRVHPTSISRRKSNVTRVSKRIPAGRRPENYVVKGNIRTPHNLSHNISKSKPNAKKHGRSH
ncbi:hypothetical protein ACI65C_006803 [Semiaphis heraclei]